MNAMIIDTTGEWLPDASEFITSAFRAKTKKEKRSGKKRTFRLHKVKVYKKSYTILFIHMSQPYFVLNENLYLFYLGVKRKMSAHDSQKSFDSKPCYK